jgi:hypothetical protein
MIVSGLDHCLLPAQSFVLSAMLVCTDLAVGSGREIFVMFDPLYATFCRPCVCCANAYPSRQNIINTPERYAQCPQIYIDKNYL